MVILTSKKLIMSAVIEEVCTRNFSCYHCLGWVTGLEGDRNQETATPVGSSEVVIVHEAATGGIGVVGALD